MLLNDFIGYLFEYGALILAGIGSVLLIVMAMGLAISWHKYLVLGYLLVVLLVAQPSSFGSETGQASFTAYFWIKGSKNFFFSFLDMMLFGTWFLSVVLLYFWRNRNVMLYNPLSKWYLLFLLLFLGFLMVAAFDGKSLILEFSSRGIFNVLWQGMFVSLLFVTLKSEEDIKRLILIMVICIAGREVFGLFRYMFFGGDPQNYYANFQFVNVKMTFWDINDSLLACFMVGFSLWKLLVEKQGNWEKVVYAILAGMALLTPALTSRRTAQGALLLAIIVLYFLLPKGRKWPILLVISLVVPLVFFALIARSGESTKPLIEKILLDVKMDSAKEDSKDDRFYELMVAWRTVKERPFFGVGPTGSFKVNSPVGLYYHHGVYDFVHSGLGHVLLKTGFTGLTIFLGIYVSFLYNLRKGWQYILPEHKPLVVGAVCVFAAQLPNLLTGTHVVEIRTMQVVGLMLALPLICINIGRKRARIVDDINHNPQ